MKNNGRPAIALKPHEVLTYGPGQTTTITCRDCSNAHGLVRGTVVNHNLTDRGFGAKEVLCDGSRQRVTIKFTPEQWKEHLAEGNSQANARRATTPLRKPKLTAKPAVSQMQTSTARLRSQLTDHQAGCLRCRRSQLWCEEAALLKRRINNLRQQPRTSGATSLRRPVKTA